MNTTASPPKRRALAPIDVNARSPLCASHLSPSKPDFSIQKMALAASRVDLNTIKRPIIEQQENDRDAPGSASKKRRLSSVGSDSLSPPNEMSARKDDDSDTRPRSISPEDPSVFDTSTSTTDNSHITAITETDGEATVAPPAAAESRHCQGGMTREEARRKAEILRLRLGLASYKVKTNQADVPLEKLQVRPIPGRMSNQTRLTASFPPARSVSPRRALPVLRPEAEKTSRSWARSEGAPSPHLSAQSPLPSREPDDSAVILNSDKSPEQRKEPEPTLPPLPAALDTLSQRTAEQDAELADSERGGAAEGLLSLSQGSPVPCLK